MTSPHCHISFKCFTKMSNFLTRESFNTHSPMFIMSVQLTPLSRVSKRAYVGYNAFCSDREDPFGSNEYHTNR